MFYHLSGQCMLVDLCAKALTAAKNNRVYAIHGLCCLQTEAGAASGKSSLSVLQPSGVDLSVSQSSGVHGEDGTGITENGGGRSTRPRILGTAVLEPFARACRCWLCHPCSGKWTPRSRCRVKERQLSGCAWPSTQHCTAGISL